MRRLQKVKPSRGISREEQLNSYKSTLLHGVPIAALHPEPCSGKRSRLSSHSGSISGRSYSMNSLRGTASECSISTAVSCQSSHAGSRPSSGKLSERPPWNSKWWIAGCSIYRTFKSRINQASEKYAYRRHRQMFKF